MIESMSLLTSAGNFYVHFLKGASRRLLVFVPGLMEPKAGLFYIWADMARYFNRQGHSCLLFDLAGQGDSQLPLSIDIWREQRNAILARFNSFTIHFVARGIGSILLTSSGTHFAIHPSLQELMVKQLPYVRWQISPFCLEHLTPAAPQDLSDIEKAFFHRLGAEAECIGGLQLPLAFLNELPQKHPHQLPDNILCYEAREGHPLFDKLSQREVLTQKIASDLASLTL